jgi:hypothetical protein
MSNIRNLLEKMDQFAGQSVGQKPGDQVRGTDKATKKKSGQHPFAGRLVGASESAGSLLRELQLELNKPEATVRRDLFREFAEYRQGVTEEIKEGLAPRNPYVELLIDLSWFMSMNTQQIQQDAIDSAAQQELAVMQRQLRSPIINGKSFSEVIADHEMRKHPKVAPVLLKFAYDILGYIEPRIKKYVRPDEQSQYLTRLNTLKDLYRAAIQFTSGQQSVTEEDAWHSSEDAPQDAWHSSQDAPQDAWHGATAESEGDAEGLPHLTTELVGNILQQMKTQGPQAISKSIEWGDGAATELTELIRHALEDYLDHAALDEEIAAPMTPGVAPTAPAANAAANPAAVAQMKAQQLKTLAAQKKSTQDQIKQTQEQLDALRKQLASLSNPANVAMPSVTGTV